MTIAQHWQDYREHCYAHKVMAPELEREYRMLFFAGFRACQLYFGDMSRSGMTAEQMQQSVLERFEEFDAFAREYVTQRQREQ